MATYSTTFSGQTTGANSTNFTDRFDAETDISIENPALGEIDDRVLQFGSGDTGFMFQSFDDVDGDANRANSEILVKYRITHDDFRGNIIVLRASGSSGSETCYLVDHTDGRFRFVRYVSGSESALIATAYSTEYLNPLVYQRGGDDFADERENEWHWCRFRVNGTGATVDLKAKFWIDGYEEPDDWRVEYSDTSGSRITAAGWTGVGKDDSTTQTTYYDYVGVGTNGDTAPSPADDTGNTLRVTNNYAQVLMDGGTARVTNNYANVLLSGGTTRVTNNYAQVLLGGKEADVKFRTVRTTIPTSGSTLDITISGFGDVQAAIGMVTEAGTNDTITSDASLTIGFLDRQGTPNEHTTSLFDEDGSPGSNCERGHYSTAFLRGQNTTGAEEFNLSFNSWITDGVRLDINNNPTSARLLTVTFIGGSHTTNSYVNSVNLGTGTSAIDVTALGFEPDLVFFMSAGVGINSSSTYCTPSLGVAHNDGADTQGVLAAGHADASLNAFIDTIIRNDAVATQISAGGTQWYASVSTFDSSGFSITPSANASNDDVSYLALKFSNNPDISIDFISSPTSTGSWSTTAPNFFPNYMMLFMREASTAVNTLTRADGYSIYSVDQYNEYSNTVIVEDGAATMYSKSLSTDKIRDTTGAGTDLHVATHASFDATGATFNFTTAPASSRTWMALSIGQNSVGGGTTRVTNVYAQVLVDTPISTGQTIQCIIAC